VIIAYSHSSISLATDDFGRPRCGPISAGSSPRARQACGPVPAQRQVPQERSCILTSASPPGDLVIPGGDGARPYEVQQLRSRRSPDRPDSSC
jgi:hypothetical protein